MPRIKTLLTCVFMTLSLSLVAGAVYAQPEPPASDPTQNSSEHVTMLNSEKAEVHIVERSSRIIELPERMTRVDRFDGELISVTPLSPYRIRVQAKATGVTTMVVTNEYNKEYNVDIYIEGDVRHLQAYINRLYPESSVTAVKVGEGVVLRGWVSDPDNINQIVEIAQQFSPKVINQMKVGGVNQVQLRVKVMEVQRSRVRQMGFNWKLLGDSGYINSNPGSLAPVSGIDLPFGGPPSVTTSAASIANSTLSFGLTNANYVLQGFLEALKTEGLLKIKADTALTTTSGRPANLLSGGEFPILVPQGVGTVSIQWREFGVRLEFVPIVLGGGNLRLEVAPEISERDFSNAVQVNGLTVPGLTTRRVNTQVEMKFGQTLIIGGLISAKQSAETSKVPLLGELPWAGALFRRVKYQENETELLIMVTPEFVAPLDSNQINGGPGSNTDIPTDKELYGLGLMEVPVTANDCYGVQGGQFQTRCMPQNQVTIPPGAIQPNSMDTITTPIPVPAPGMTPAPTNAPYMPETMSVNPSPTPSLAPMAPELPGAAKVPDQSQSPPLSPGFEPAPIGSQNQVEQPKDDLVTRWNPFKSNIMPTRYKSTEQTSGQGPTVTNAVQTVESSSKTTVTKPGLIRPGDLSSQK
jgi:pilus assembly protein CpaC